MKKYIFISFVFFLISKVCFTQNLGKDTIKIEEVVVTGTRVGITRENVSMTVTVISKEEIEQSGESALLPIISERVPGVFVTERGVTGFGVATGINVRYRFIMLGFEYNSDNLKLESQDYPGEYFGSFSDDSDKTPMPSLSFSLGFSF